MKKSVAIIGGGAAGIMLASCLDESQFDITIYEQNNTLGRKFLVAGDGGLNLTHSEPLASFLTKYHPYGFMDECISAFPNTSLVLWLKELGIETYIGSSARIFPQRGIKPIQVLMTILEHIKSKNISIQCNHTWMGWNEDMQMVFQTKEQQQVLTFDFIIFSLGGASWKKTGSNGLWSKRFEEKNIKIIPFQASNCAFGIHWPADFLKTAEGQSLKNIAIQCDQKSIKGELMITQFGLEGGAIYALSHEIRNQLYTLDEAKIYIDLKPQLTVEHIEWSLKHRGNQSIQKILSTKIKCSSVSIVLLKNTLTKEEFINPNLLAYSIKHLPLTIYALAPIDEAISTVGGVALNEVNSYFELKKLNHHYVIGEMLDWDAPTGGYLLQASLSMGYFLAQHLNSTKKN